MIPNISILTEEITQPTYSNETYKIAFDSDRIDGTTDDLEAIKQAIYLILSTERYQHIIYSWDYGVELLTLIGKPVNHVIYELPRRITEALKVDNRITDVIDFEFEQTGNKLHTTFTVVSTAGNITTGLEVTI